MASPSVPQAPTSSAIDPTNASAVSVRFMTPPMQAETAIVPQPAETAGQAAPRGRYRVPAFSASRSLSRRPVTTSARR